MTVAIRDEDGAGTGAATTSLTIPKPTLLSGDFLLRLLSLCDVQLSPASPYWLVCARKA